jgi:hypothetical protein
MAAWLAASAALKPIFIVLANGRLRRIFPVPAGFGEGPLTAPTAATQARRHELVFMPHIRPSSQLKQASASGGLPTFEKPVANG